MWKYFPLLVVVVGCGGPALGPFELPGEPPDSGLDVPEDGGLPALLDGTGPAVETAPADRASPGIDSIPMDGPAPGIDGAPLLPCRGPMAAGTSSLHGTPAFFKAADLDSDGRPDVVATNSYEGLFSVALASGDGAFAPGQDYLLGSWVTGVAIADFDGDGFADIALAESSEQLGPSNGIVVAANRGNGTFSQPVSIVAGDWGGLAAGDLDGDGHVDLAATSWALGIMAVFHNRGDGTFEKLASYTARASIIDVWAVDLNADGRLDIVAGGARSEVVNVWMSLGKGAFSAQATYPTGIAYAFLVAADFDRDGYADVAMANGESDVVNVLRNRGDGTFAAAVSYPAGRGSNHIAAGDLDGDGFEDIVVANPASQTVGLLLNRGDGTFGRQASYPTTFSPVAVAVADFDGDRLADVAVAGSQGTLDVLRSRCR
jgi:hypothetical protein